MLKGLNERRKVIFSLLGIVNFLIPCCHILCDTCFCAVLRYELLQSISDPHLVQTIVIK